MNFHAPELENRSQIELTKNGGDLIKIKCIDFKGRAIYGAVLKNENTSVVHFLQNNGTFMKIHNMTFPVTFTVSGITYQTTTFTVTEPSGYDIDITLDDNRGFTNVEGQRKYKIISKEKKQLILEPVADFSDNKIKNRRIYKIKK